MTWSFDRTAVLWKVESRERLQTLSHEGEVNGAAWNEDESQILTWSRDGIAVVWEAESGKWLQTLSHDEGWPVLGGAWNEDESKILTWSGDGTSILWEAESGERLQTLSHESAVKGAAWNGDESKILTWSGDRTSKIWDGQTGQPLRIITPDGTLIYDAKWNQNEDRLLMATAGGIAKTYYTDMDELITSACKVATRNFNWDEWRLYLPGEPYRKICPELPIHPSVPQEEIQQ